MTEATIPQLKLSLPGFSDEELGDLIGWAASLEVRHAIAAPIFCQWLVETTVAEIRRRTGDGSQEAGSVSLPGMGPGEIAVALLCLQGRTYAPQSVRVGKFFDEVTQHVTALACCQLFEFQSLCERSQERATDGN